MTTEHRNINPVEDTKVTEPVGRFKKAIDTVLQVLGIDEFISSAQVLHNFFFVLAIVGIGVIEIFNTHLAVRLNRTINKKKETIKELRWEFMTVKTEMNLKSKQSELQKVLEPYGIKALQEPPKKIEVKKGTLRE